jgi:hypothetical protein
VAPAQQLAPQTEHALAVRVCVPASLLALTSSPHQNHDGRIRATHNEDVCMRACVCVSVLRGYRE